MGGASSYQARTRVRGRQHRDGSRARCRRLPPTSISNPKARTLKLIFAGDQDTGKSCLCRRFAVGNYDPEAAALIGVDLKVRKVDLNGRTVTLQLWDVDGQRLRASTSMSMRYIQQKAPSQNFRGCSFYGAVHGVLVVYDASRRATFDSLKYWIEAVRAIKATQGVRILLLGNKCDLPEKGKEVDFEEAKRFADEQGVPFMEVSAMDGTNVELAIMSLVAGVEDSADRSGV